MERLKDLPRGERERIEATVKERLEKEERIVFAYLHGSFTEGRPFRDIDISVFVDESRVSKEKTLNFEVSFSVELEDTIRMPIDVKVINYAPLAFQYYSTAGTLLMCRDDDFRVDFLTRIRSLYFDFRPSSERFLMEMLYAE
ncbi:MAG: nucleotidyltransferase domain-containing protein [Thermodesulfobacteriota bacterium]